MRVALSICMLLSMTCGAEEMAPVEGSKNALASVNGVPVDADWVRELAKEEKTPSLRKALDEAIAFELLAQEAEVMGYGRKVDPQRVQRRAAVQRLLAQRIEHFDADDSLIAKKLQDAKDAHTVADGFFDARQTEEKLRAAETDRKRFSELAKMLQVLETEQGVTRNKPAIRALSEVSFQFDEPGL